MPEATDLLDLRVAQPGDLPFLFDLYCDVRGPEVSAWGWPAIQRDAFLRMQFEAQRRGYEAAYPEAIHHIVLCGGEAIGHRLAASTREGMRLVDIALLAAHRKRGIGSRLIRQLMDDCRGSRSALRLQVLRGNPVQGLYRRLGFTETGADQMYIEMAWTPERGPST
ncbi:MAG: GNAT family N-acetyltransferase [Terracidiphilus sp.]|nr:GNAT family N-acetyltransferase [Terracidiphilus sp.]